ncbi:MAG: hypothetical protein Q4Q58_07080 [Thermoplasmata archaeon]|nr:hypothetical protein [Thermoplasmata archaeon]
MTDGPAPHLIVRRPDKNTSEAILYGSQYLFYKSTSWWYDMLEEQLMQEFEQEKAKIRDKTFAADVLLHRPHMIFSRQAPVNDVNKIRELKTIREAVKRGTAIQMVKLDRKNNEMYARLHGVNEFTQRYLQDGISESTWKVATGSRNPPIDYDAVKALASDYIRLAEEEVKDFGSQVEQYNKARAEYAKHLEKYRAAIEAGNDYVPDPFEDDMWGMGYGEQEPEAPLYGDIVKDVMDEARDDRDPLADIIGRFEVEVEHRDEAADDPASDAYWNESEADEGEDDEPEEMPIRTHWSHARMHTQARACLYDYCEDEATRLLGVLDAALAGGDDV